MTDILWQSSSIRIFGVFGYGAGVVYLTSPGVQPILAYSWARPAILVAGKGKGKCFYSVSSL